MALLLEAARLEGKLPAVDPAVTDDYGGMEVAVALE
jgi:hypothetical protein